MLDLRDAIDNYDDAFDTILDNDPTTTNLEARYQAFEQVLPDCPPDVAAGLATYAGL